MNKSSSFKVFTMSIIMSDRIAKNFFNFFSVKDRNVVSPNNFVNSVG